MAFTADLIMHDKDARITLTGELDASVADKFKLQIDKAAEGNPVNLVLFMEGLKFMASAGLRVLVYSKQKMGAGVSIHVVGAAGPVLNTLLMSGFDKAVYLKDTY